MKWSRELRIARRSIRTAVRAASAMASAQARLPATLRQPAWPATASGQSVAGPARVEGFGSNPGGLDMFVHVPSVPPTPGAALIVLLHGCGQTAVTFAREAGWAALSERLRVPLVLAEQSGENNHGRCFNWFRPDHVRRDAGEALSIRQMAAAGVARFGSDPERVFIAGLSAGGAMAAALLAAYPDVFAAGAVVAGLPVGAASSTPEALRRMAEAGPVQSRTAWAALARRAAPADFAGPWPRLSIWHGEADRVVDPANARLLAEQWSELHGLANMVAATDPTGIRREVWGRSRLPAVELWTLPGVAHAWPEGAAARIARFWGLGTR